MNIGFDISQTGDAKAGCGFFAANLIQHLTQLDSKNHYSLYALWGNLFHDPDFKKIEPVAPSGSIKYVKHSDFETEKNFWDKEFTNSIYPKKVPDIMHSNNFFCPNAKLKNTKLVYTLYDISFLEHPEHTTEENRLCCFEGILNASIFSDHIISISEYSKYSFLKTFPFYPEESITVIHPGTRFAKLNPSFQPALVSKKFTPNRFILSVGTLEPRKNHINLIKAYKKLKENKELENIPLVLAGQVGWMTAPMDRLIEELNLERDVIKLGRVSDNDLIWLYQNCIFMIFPSFFEGFGLPIVEAMSLGAAVINSNTSSMTEITGNASLLINPYDIDNISDAMHTLLHNESQRIHFKKTSLKRAELFSWNKAARDTLSIYESLYKK